MLHVMDLFCDKKCFSKEDIPYMLSVAPIANKKRKKIPKESMKLFRIKKLNVSRSEIPAVTHVNFSAPIQTVNSTTKPIFHALIVA